MSAQKIIVLRHEILELLPDKGKALFEEYNMLVASMVEDLTDLNERQQELLKNVANRSKN